MDEHDWQYTGVIISVAPSFPEQACSKCGCIAWGNSKTGEFVPEQCPGNYEAFQAWYRERVNERNARALARMIARTAERS